MATLLSIHEKATAVDLYGPIRLSAHAERDAATADDDLRAVRDLRAAAVESPSLPDPFSLDQRRDALLAYARALALVESRFPISPDREHVLSLSFTWHDAFNMNQKVCLPSVHLERAAVLFNIGAIYSQIALAADRTTDIGVRTACGAFESAAGAFAWLRESGLAAKAIAAGVITVDVTPECTGMLEKLMLGQAQECLFEKFIAGGKPPKLCSKVARQAGIFYEEAYGALCAPPLSQHFDKTWISHIQMKAAQFYADACYRCSLDLHQAEEIAQEIVRLQIGMNALADAKKAAKGVAAPLLHSVYKLESNMKTNLERAMKENNSMYLMQIPDVGSLGALPAACHVASKQRLFSSLVPEDSMTEAEKLQQSSEISGVRLKEMDPSGFLPSLEGNVSIPVDLKEDGMAVQIRGGPSGLEAELQLRDLNRVSEDLLVQTEEVLQKEACEDAQFWTQVGSLSADGYMCSLIRFASPSVPSSILDLPNDILLVIADIVRSPHQLERMRLVCRVWRNFLESRLGPYLVISYENPSHLDRVHILQLPEAQDAAAAMVPMLARSFDPILPPAGTGCWGSAHGLLAMVHGEPYESTIFLHCIHCGERIPLPPCAAEMIPKGIFFRAAALHDYLVIAWVRQNDRPRLLNDAIDWNDIEAGYRWFLCIGYENFGAASVAFLPNVLMGVAVEERFVVVDEVGRPIQDWEALIMVDIPPVDNSLVPWKYNHRHIFVCEGRLYLCLLFDEYAGTVQEGDTRVRVRLFELVNDENGYRLIPSESLGPHSVFLGPNQAIVLPAVEGHIGRRPNTIYVQDCCLMRCHSRVLAVNLSTEAVTVIGYPASLAAEWDMKDMKLSVWTCSPREDGIFDHCQGQ